MSWLVTCWAVVWGEVYYPSHRWLASNWVVKHFKGQTERCGLVMWGPEIRLTLLKREMVVLVKKIGKGRSAGKPVDS